MVQIAVWDRDKNAGRVGASVAQAFAHPQLGDVEVGGIDPRVGMWNPPPEEMPKVCRTQSAHYLRVGGARAGGRAGGGRDREGARRRSSRASSVTVANHGYLPTYILASAKDADAQRAAVGRRHAATAASSPIPTLAHREIGHLDGWGRGLFDGSGALYYTCTRGTTGARTLVVGRARQGDGRACASARAASAG